MPSERAVTTLLTKLVLTPGFSPFGGVSNPLQLQQLAAGPAHPPGGPWGREVQAGSTNPWGRLAGGRLQGCAQQPAGLRALHGHHLQQGQAGGTRCAGIDEGTGHALIRVSTRF